MGVSQVVTYPQSVSIVWLKTQQPGKSSDALPAPDIVLHDSLRGTSVLRWCDLLPCVFSHKQTNLMILQCFPAFLCSASPLIKWLTMVMMKAAIDFLFFCEIVYQDLKKTWVSEWVSDRHGKPMVSTLVIRSKCISSALGPSTKYQILAWSAYIFMCNIFLQWSVYLLCSVCPEKVITSKRQMKVPNLWQSQCTAAATLI